MGWRLLCKAPNPIEGSSFCNLHALLSENLLGDPGGSGHVRKIPVDISGTVYQPLAIPQQVEEYFHRILAKADGIVDPLEQAFFIMVHIPYLQPFEDMNKRVSRLGAHPEEPRTAVIR